MLNIKMQDKIACSEMRKRTKLADIAQHTLKQNWKWAEEIATMEDSRWTKQCIEWPPRGGMFVGCLTSQQQTSVSQGRICSDNFTCCHTEIVVADQTLYLT